MKNKKNGFIFLETIIVLSVTALVVTTLGINYSVIRSRSVHKLYYNRASETYALYTLMNIGTNSTTNYKNASSFIVDSSNCSSKLYTSNCSSIFNDMNIERVAYVTNIESEIDNNSTSYGSGMLNYMETLSKNNKYVIGEFKIGDKYYYSSVIMGD